MGWIGVDKMGGQEIQTFSSKINKKWGCDVQPGDSS